MTAVPADSRPVLLAVAHGTRDPLGVRAYDRLVHRMRTLRPGLCVRLAHLDIVRPSLAEVLAELRGEVVVVPLLLSAGYHVRVDIPAALADAPRVRARVAAALGPDPLLTTALSDRLAQAGWRRGPTRCAAAGQAVVLAAAGSSDPAANADTVRTGRLLERRLQVEVVPAYLSASSPTPAEAVARLRATGRQVAVASCLLAPGFFARRAAAAGAELTGEPVGTHAAVARLALRRYDQALAPAQPSALQAPALQYTSLR